MSITALLAIATSLTTPPKGDAGPACHAGKTPPPYYVRPVNDLVHAAFNSCAAAQYAHALDATPPSHAFIKATLEQVCHDLRHRGFDAFLLATPRSRHGEYKQLALMIGQRNHTPLQARFMVEAQRRGTVTLTGIAGPCLLVSSMPTPEYSTYYLERALSHWLSELARYATPAKGATS